MWRYSIFADTEFRRAPCSFFQHIDFEGRRPGLVIFATMVALVVNWTTTLGIFLITCEAVVMRRAYILKVRCNDFIFFNPSSLTTPKGNRYPRGMSHCALCASLNSGHLTRKSRFWGNRSVLLISFFCVLVGSDFGITPHHPPPVQSVSHSVNPIGLMLTLWGGGKQISSVSYQTSSLFRSALLPSPFRNYGCTGVHSRKTSRINELLGLYAIWEWGRIRRITFCFGSWNGPFICSLLSPLAASQNKRHTRVTLDSGNLTTTSDTIGFM